MTRTAKFEDLYSTIETRAWSMCLNYSNYADFHKSVQQDTKILSEQGYKDFCNFMENEMLRDIGVGV